MYFDYVLILGTFKNTWEVYINEWIPSICGKHFDSIINLREFYNSFEMSSMSYFDDLFDILF